MHFTQGHALLIGVGEYQHAPHMNVPATVADAQVLADVLRNPRFCGYPEAQVDLLHDATATKQAILSALDRLAARASPGDTVMLFYCGHGAYGHDGQFYLTAFDTHFDGGRVAAGDAVSHSELLPKVKMLAARRVLLIFNACHAGAMVPNLGAADVPRGANLPDATAAALLATGEGRIVITACRADQFSYIGDGPLTIFSRALVDTLRGTGVTSQRGYISVFDLYTAVYDAVRGIVHDRYDRLQEPEITVHKGVGPFAVALFQGAAPQGDLEAGHWPAARTAVREVSPQQSQSLYEQIVRGGVVFGSGTIGTIDGEIVGGDQQIGGDKVGGNKIGGDSAGRDIDKSQNTFNISGAIHAGLANVGGTMNIDTPLNIRVDDPIALSGGAQGTRGDLTAYIKQAKQRLDALLGADAAAKQRLALLLDRLQDVLLQAPLIQAADAEQVARRTVALINEVSRPTRDQDLLIFDAESLKRAAAPLDRVLPVATELVSLIGELTH